MHGWKDGCRGDNGGRWGVDEEKIDGDGKEMSKARGMSTLEIQIFRIGKGKVDGETVAEAGRA